MKVVTLFVLVMDLFRFVHADFDFNCAWINTGGR